MANYDAMVRIPVLGEVWEIDGVYESHPLYGIQMQASKSRCCRPRKDEIVLLLGRHPGFTEIGTYWAKKIWEQCKEDFYRILDAGDACSLCELGMPAKMALATISEWHEYLEKIILCNELTCMRLSLKLRSQLSDYIPLLLHTEFRSIYDYFPVIPWSYIDSHWESTSAGTDDDRLVTACDAVFVMGTQAILHAIDERDFLRRLSIRLHGNSQKEIAFSKAVAKGNIICIYSGRNRLVHTDALRKITTAFLSKLRNFVGAGMTENNALRVVSVASSSANSAVSLVSCSGWGLTASLKRLVEAFPGALHIAAASASHQNVIVSIAWALDGDYLTSVDINRTVFIHGTQCLDLLTVNKLIQRLPVQSNLILVGSSDVMHQPSRPSPFHALWQAEGSFDRLEIAATSCLIQMSSPLLMLHGVNARVISTANLSTMFEKALASYREAACEGSALIVASSLIFCHRMNTELAQEQLEDLKILRRDTRGIRLPRDGHATANCPVTWRQINLTKRRLTGEAMRITAVNSPASERIRGAITELLVGTVQREDGSTIALSAADASDLTLAYALTVPVAAHGRWDTVIVLCAGGESCNRDWVRAAASLASKNVILVGDVETIMNRKRLVSALDVEPLMKQMLENQ
ncbi:hypothetical protein [Cupriavidus basilensis]|uniref:hypothetical protein n=1 Tax=Cupriavidus basilensis TaxID=68895 RepID=UPI0020A6C591|nr:hypothetical protein [Cupriavidus basilensis]MCP3022773.1 hypothetical protein [Cupriavidus basilensis]